MHGTVALWAPLVQSAWQGGLGGSTTLASSRQGLERGAALAWRSTLRTVKVLRASELPSRGADRPDADHMTGQLWAEGFLSACFACLLDVTNCIVYKFLVLWETFGLLSLT